MFADLPLEIEYKIWKIYYSKYVLPKIKTCGSIWKNWKNKFPSDKLFKNCSDYGAIQINHTDFEKIFDKPNIDLHTSLFKIILGRDRTDWCADCYFQLGRTPCKQLCYEIDFGEKAWKLWNFEYNETRLTYDEIISGKMISWTFENLDNNLNLDKEKYLYF